MLGRLFGNRAQSGESKQRGNKGKQVGKQSNQEIKRSGNQRPSVKGGDKLYQWGGAKLYH